MHVPVLTVVEGQGRSPPAIRRHPNLGCRGPTLRAARATCALRYLKHLLTLLLGTRESPLVERRPRRYTGKPVR